MICIVDYGTGNVLSILNMLSYIGVKARVINNPKELTDASKIILPGIGSFDNAMKKINEKWIHDLNESVLVKKKIILGICLGMQIMCNNSEEGELKGLSWINADVKKFQFEDSSFKIPHMGWNYVNIMKENSLIKFNNEINRFYFVHSYHVCLNNNKDELGQTFYGYNFTSSFQNENIFGVQFHPEKSHNFGFNLLKNFSKL